MEKDLLDKANDLYSDVLFWKSRVDNFKKVIEHPNCYHVMFEAEHDKVSLETNMNYELNVIFAKQCFEYAKKKLEEAIAIFEKL